MTYNILNFDSQSAAQTCLNAVFAAIVSIRQGQGYTIINNQIVPKNAATGLDDLTAIRSNAWDYVTASPASPVSYYFSSPNNVSDYSAILASLSGVCTGDEIPLPAGWPNPAQFSQDFSSDFATGGTP